MAREVPDARMPTGAIRLAEGYQWLTAALAGCVKEDLPSVWGLLGSCGALAVGQGMRRSYTRGLNKNKPFHGPLERRAAGGMFSTSWALALVVCSWQPRSASPQSAEHTVH